MQSTRYFGRLPSLAAAANSKRWSSGVAGAAAASQGLPSAFPWREAPDNRVQGLLGRALYAFMQKPNRRILRLVNSIDRDDSFLPAAEMAFVQVAAGVFQMRACQVAAPLAEEGSEGAQSEEAGVQGKTERGWLSNMPEGDIVDPRDVMHEDLAQFYLEAAVATKVSRCTPFYRLHRICGSKVSNVNMLWGARRGDLPTGEDIVEFMGTKAETESLRAGFEALMKARLSKDPDRLADRDLSSLRKTTMQVDVDVLCRETFFVTDDRTEEVVQGSKAVGSRTHRLRLECSPIFNFDYQWTAVDLDNWMKGNTFW